LKILLKVNTFALEIFDNEGSCCTLYTVRWYNEAISETDKFFSKYGGDKKFERSIQELAIFLTKKISKRNWSFRTLF